MTSRKDQRSKVKKREGTLSGSDERVLFQKDLPLSLLQGLAYGICYRWIGSDTCTAVRCWHSWSWPVLPAGQQKAGLQDDLIFHSCRTKHEVKGGEEKEEMLERGGDHSWLILAYSTDAEFNPDNYNIPGSNFLHVQALHLNYVLM